MTASRTAAIVACAVAVCLPPAARSAPKSKEEMQRQLNEQVMNAPFDPGDIDKAEAYAEEAKRRNETPVARPPAYWAPGWTCANLTAYAYYNYGDYRNCIYYHHYYGRYWRYR